MDWINIIGVAISVLTGGGIGSIIGIRYGVKKQRNDMLKDMQDSIDLVVERNKKMMEEILQLRNDNIDLRTEVAGLKSQNTQLRKEVEELNKRLENVKTITRTK